MAKINLRNLNTNNMVLSLKGQKIYIYGSNDTGKTYQSCHLDKPLLIMTEAGGNAVNCPKVPCTRWGVFKDLVNQLTSEKKDKNDKNERMEWETMQELYQTIIIDTVDNLIEQAEKSVCQEFDVRDLSEIEDSRKNGYSIYRKDFKSQIDKLCMYGYTIIFLGHEEYVERKDNGKKITYMQPKGSDNVKSSSRFIRDLCDFCIGLLPNGVDEDGNTILSTAICKETKEVFARSRYVIKSRIEEFTAENLKNAIIDGIKNSANIEGATVTDWKKTNDEYSAKDWIELIQPYYKAIFKKYPDRIKEMVAIELGEGVKISSCTDDDVIALENLYSQMVTFSEAQGIKIS